MKFRILAMAGIAAITLATPAFAGNGWYLGLAGGYSQLDENLPVIYGPSARSDVSRVGNACRSRWSPYH